MAFSAGHITRRHYARRYGFLTQLYKSLKPQILGELLVINNLTTAYALEIGHQLMNEQLFYGIAKTAEKKFKTDVQYFEGFSVEKYHCL